MMAWWVRMTNQIMYSVHFYKEHGEKVTEAGLGI